MNNEVVKKVLLLIADISGYTRFMTSSSMEIEHSQRIISGLLNSVIEQIQLPLEIAKLEGDAVFLFADKQTDAFLWEQTRKTIGSKLLSFFDAFHVKLAGLVAMLDCDCGACSNANLLKLKIVVHSGEALFYQIQGFRELSGKDVILIHRLLKNSADQNEYILMTEAAFSDIEFPVEVVLKQNSEKYEHFGEIKTMIHFPVSQ